MHEKLELKIDHIQEQMDQEGTRRLNGKDITIHPAIQMKSVLQINCQGVKGSWGIVDYGRASRKYITLLCSPSKFFSMISANTSEENIYRLQILVVLDVKGDKSLRLNANAKAEASNG